MPSNSPPFLKVHKLKEEVLSHVSYLHTINNMLYTNKDNNNNIHYHLLNVYCLRSLIPLKLSTKL